jgi:hypothetical protein
MNIKVGQWARDNSGNIVFIKTAYNTYSTTKGFGKVERERYIKVADTPQELIQVGDTLVLDNGKNMGLPQLKVEELFDGGFKYRSILSSELADIYYKEYRIIKILTPNAYGCELQWEVK